MENSSVNLLWYTSTEETSVRYTARDLWKMSTAGKIRSTFAFITIFVGVVGNSISFKVMTSKTMRVSSTGVYFAAIAIADTATLLTGQLAALLLNIGHFNVVSVHYWSCRWFFFMLFTFADTAVWLMLAVTVDRFISVVFPLKRKKLCTPKRSVVCCVCLVSIAMLKNLHLFWTRGRQPRDGIIDECGYPTPEYEYFETFIRPWLAFTLYAFVPLTGIAVFNVTIAIALWRHSKSQAGQGNENQGGGSRASRQAAQLTVMLLTVSVAFTILITPSIVVLIAKPYVATTPSSIASYSLIESVVDTLAYINHSTNFFFYCLSGAGFRKEVLKMFGFKQNMVEPTEASAPDATRHASAN